MEASIPDSQDVIRPDWWAGFEDAYLNQLVDQAVAGDYDLKLLATRIEIAAAAAGVERANALPKFSPDASKRFQRDPTGDSDTYSLSFSSSWELDVWGRVQKGIESKESEFRATEADWVAGSSNWLPMFPVSTLRLESLIDRLSNRKNPLNRTIKSWPSTNFKLLKG